MAGRLLLLVILVPLIELALLMELTRWTSLPVTVAIVFLTGVTGMTMVRRQGLLAWRQIQQRLASAQSPSAQIMDGVMILLAGAFLITPGPLTDVVGFSLLVPQFRRWLSKKLQARLMKNAGSSFQSHVWVAGGPFSTADHADFGSPPETASEQRPQVRVVDPNSSRLPEE